MRIRFRESLPSARQWRVACFTVIGAAGIGFAVGRSSSRTHESAKIATAAPPPHAACPPDVHPAAPPPPARDEKLVTAETANPSADPGSITVPAATTSNPIDDAERQATEKAVARAITRGTNRTPNCRGPGSPSGVAHVTVTFQPSGDVKLAVLRGAPFAGTAEGECIAGKFRTLKVPPFAGENVTVTKTLNFD